MTKGLFGAPRPFVRPRIFIDREELEVNIRRVGPMGFSRPFSQSRDREVTEEDIEECMQSEAAHEFAKGVKKSIGVNTPEEVVEATESWCEGILQATTKPTNDPAEILPEKYIPPEAEIIEAEGEVVDTKELPEE